MPIVDPCRSAQHAEQRADWHRRPQFHDETRDRIRQGNPTPRRALFDRAQKVSFSSGADSLVKTLAQDVGSATSVRDSA
jgi:hypothetical protein